VTDKAIVDDLVKSYSTRYQRDKGQQKDESLVRKRGGTVRETA